MSQAPAPISPKSQRSCVNWTLLAPWLLLNYGIDLVWEQPHPWIVGPRGEQIKTGGSKIPGFFSQDYLTIYALAIARGISQPA
jgi:hypothetical protein